MGEFIFYIVSAIALSAWLWYKVKTNEHKYMSQEWMKGAGL